MTWSRCQLILSWRAARSRHQRPWRAALMQPGGRVIPAAAAISAAKVIVKGLPSNAHRSTFLCSVSDPYSFVRIWIQHFRLTIDPNPEFWYQKFKKITAEKKYFFHQSAIYLSLGLSKERPSYRRSIQTSKENIQHFKTWNYLIFFYFCTVVYFCPPGSGSGFWIWIRIRARIYWPDWFRIHSGFGSEILLYWEKVFWQLN